VCSGEYPVFYALHANLSYLLYKNLSAKLHINGYDYILPRRHIIDLEGWSVLETWIVDNKDRAILRLQGPVNWDFWNKYVRKYF